MDASVDENFINRVIQKNYPVIYYNAVIQYSLI